MPTYFARKAGNINAADVWATMPSGTASAVTFVAGDVLLSNSFAITINVDTNLGSSGQIRNDNTGGATAGGSFTLNSGLRLDANVFAGATASCLLHTGTGATVVGNITAGSASGAHGFNPNHSSGTVTITGNITGGTANNAIGVHFIGTGNISITGNCVAQSGTAVVNNNTGIMTISGNATGGTSSLPCMGVSNAGNGTLTLTGNVTAGTGSSGQGARNDGTNVLTVTGIATAGNLAPGILNNSTGRINVGRAVGNAFGLGNTAGLTSNAGVANPGNGIVEFSELEYGSLGQSPTSGTGFRLKKQSSNAVTFNLCDTAGAKTLVDATQGQMPAASDVRSGVSYASGAQTGSCAVPSASSVAFGVPVDNTTGTALLTGAAVATAVWGAATRSITGGTVDTLTNAPSVPTPAQIASQVRTELSVELGRVDAAVSSRLAPNGTLATVTTLTNAPTVPTPSEIASQVRTELATELARVDAAISTRLAGSAYTAPANSDISAIKAKTDLLETTRLAQCSTVATTGAQLAAALS
jgi:fibronectin-binding autotransporter adhesin